MLRRGDVIEVVTGGAGGYGPPHERDVVAVARDLAEERIDEATARGIYRA